MAIIEMINGRKDKSGRIISYKSMGSVKRLINYVLNPEKTNELLCQGIYCNTQNAYEEFALNKAVYGKLPEPGDFSHRQAIHFVQSFDPKDNVTPELAKKIADELVKSDAFRGYQMVYAVHSNTENAHTHFAINTVNYETGRMWQLSSQQLQEIKGRSDELCREYHLSVIPEHRKDRTHSHESSGEYRAKQRETSWKSQIFDAAKACKMVAADRAEFISLLEKLGYSVRWTEERKDITFMNSDGKKVNSDKLGYPKKGYTPFTKQELEKQFALNKQVNANQYQSIYQNQLLQKAEILERGLIKLGRMSGGKQMESKSNQTLHSMLEGEAFKEKLEERKKGKGIEWE